MIPSARSIYARVVVKGGAIRQTLRLPGNWTMLTSKPRLRHSRVTFAPSTSAGSLEPRSRTNSTPIRSPLDDVVPRRNPDKPNLYVGLTIEEPATPKGCKDPGH
jgi:hypothetical protein